MDTEKVPTIFTFNGTPVKAKSGFWLMVVLLWVLLAWVGSQRWPGQSLGAYVLVGGAAAVLGMLADVGHACAHTVGARIANAPMDVILLGADMPRTLYDDNDVPPKAHILRSLGGPVYSAIGLLIGIAWLLLTPSGTAWRYLGEVWTFANGFIFLALFAPIPIVDGGVIMKWLFVMRGRTEEQADKIVRNAAIGMGVVLAAVILIVLVRLL
jgi:hypothetical protein